MYSHSALIAEHAAALTPTEEKTMQTTSATPSSLADLFGETVYAYSRAQAIEDGTLVNFSDPESDTAPICQQHYKYPVACTAAVFAVMQKAVENPRHGNDYAGILHDMLWMSKVMNRKIDESTVIFRVIITGAGRSKYFDFKLVVGPGDQGEPVITIMLPNED